MNKRKEQTAAYSSSFEMDDKISLVQIKAQIAKFSGCFSRDFVLGFIKSNSYDVFF